MKRVLMVIESDLPALSFSIAAEPREPDGISKRGYLRTEDPEDGTIVYLRQIGLYDSNEEAKRAAAQYAAERGRVMDEWHVDKHSSHRGTELDLRANAMPPEDR